ncbi:MAG: CapA family protein, partial [Streptosporangiaceae bacterium]
ERGSREPGYRPPGGSEQHPRDADDSRPGYQEQWYGDGHAAQSPPGRPAPPRRQNRGHTRWTSRGRLLLAIGAAVVVIALGSWQLVAARAGNRPSGNTGHSLAGATSPKAGPSGAHPSGGASPTAAAGGTVSIDWAGDMTFGTLNAWPPDGTGSLLDGVTSDLQSDLTLGNLESALGDLTMSKCAPGESDCYQFEAPDNTAQALKQDGFAAVNVANNHTLDAGTAGETNTNAALHAAGLDYAGRPGQITYLTRNGITIALLGFAPWPYDADALDIPAAQALVSQAKQHAQIVIVMEHLGAEGDGAQHVTDSEEYYLGQDRGNSVAFTHAMIDAGADLVVGSGPHVLRGFQWYHGHLIAYSLGNFCGYDTLGLDSITSVSAILHVTLGAQGQFVSGSITPLRLVSPGTPEPDPAGAAIGTVNSLSQDDFGGNGAAVISAAGTIDPPPASDG